MYLVIWEFEVKPGLEERFEKIYSPNGLWAKLFRRAAGYLHSELVRDPKRERRYLSIDRWVSSEAFEAFLAQWREDYEALDEHCASLVDRESLLGTFTE